MTFVGKSHLKLRFTNDRRQLEGVIRRLRFHLRGPQLPQKPGQPSQARVYQAVLEACRLFPASGSNDPRRRAIVAVFGDNDQESVPQFPGVERGLLTAHVRLYGVAVQRFGVPPGAVRPSVQTPPTLPGPPTTQPIYTNRLPLPEATLKGLNRLAK
jgi:hypothetical protein